MRTNRSFSARASLANKERTMATRPRQIRENLLVFIGGEYFGFCFVGWGLFFGGRSSNEVKLALEANWVEFFITIS